MKGGTAINLFHRDMPRLSIDIDLIYLPISDRDSSLNAITNSFARIAINIDKEEGIHAKVTDFRRNAVPKINVRNEFAQIKVETSPVLRGTVSPCCSMSNCRSAEDEFGHVTLNVASFEDVYAGKIAAALDRQHPRDLFDVKVLYENEGLTEELFRAFMIYAVSSNKPMHELLAPRQELAKSLFENEFAGMARDDAGWAGLEEARRQLHADIHEGLSDDFAKFLVSVHNAEPDFACLGFPDEIAAKLEKLPAVQWKILNLEKLKRSNPAKHQQQLAMLQKLFD